MVVNIFIFKNGIYRLFLHLKKKINEQKYFLYETLIKIQLYSFIDRNPAIFPFVKNLNTLIGIIRLLIEYICFFIIIAIIFIQSFVT